MELCPPVVLARLPKPFEKDGKVQFGPVWGLREATKRKRQEICSTVDGHSVNIYSAQTGQIISSHAVPPQTTFPVAPVSVRWTKKGQVVRQTVFVVSDGNLRLCSVTQEGAETRQKPFESSIELEGSSSTVIHLDIVSAPNGDRRVIAVQEDGTITTANSDLKYVSSVKLGRDPDSDNTTIFTACCLSLHEASNTILKSREDISDLVEDAIIVATFGIQPVYSTKRHFYSAWCLRLESSQSLGSLDPLSPRLLFKHDLSSPDLAPVEITQEPSVVFGSRASSLLIKCPRTFVRFNLLGTVPKRLSNSQTDMTGAFDVLPLNPVYVFLAFHSSLQILDVKYGTAQVTLDITSNKKRKVSSSANAPAGAMKLLAYFSQAQRLLLRIGTTLVAIDATLGKGSSAKKSRTSRLADNIGRGMTLVASESESGALSLSLGETPITSKTNWAEQVSRLGQMVKENNITGFEDAVLSLFPSSTVKRSNKFSKRLRALNAFGMREEIVDYVLINMFSADSRSEPDHSPSSTSLQLNFVAPRLIEWLSSAGLLCLWRLKKLGGSQNERHLLDRLQPGDISRALYNADPSSNLLLTHIRHNSDHAIDQQVGTLKLLIGLAKAKSESQSQPNLQAREPSSALALDAERTESPEEMQMDSTSLSPALVQAIVLLMNQLGVLDQNVLSAHVQQSLSLSEITTTIQFLRQQLFSGGHASWLLPNSTNTQKALAGAIDEEAVNELGSPLVSFESIVKLLSACLDTVGPFQLLNTSRADQMVETIIPELLSEVELSARYIEDSAELQGILRETIRYSHSRETRTAKHPEETTGPEGSGRPVGEILTVYSDHSRDQAPSILTGMLPLSLRDENVVDPLKIRKGGGQVSERSKRELLMLEGRRKGSYSFERLKL